MKKYLKSTFDICTALSLFVLLASVAHGGRPNKKEEEQVCRTPADPTDANAQFELGVMYFKEEGVEKNEKEAVRLWRLAADQGHVAAQRMLVSSSSAQEG